jgi:methyl-accepting chemotaxis protein
MYLESVMRLLHGRGFSVVAEEIRKMADNSANAVKDIENIIMTIKHKTEQVLQKVIETSNIGQEQLAATEEISNAMEDLAMSAQQLNQAANMVIG